MHISRTLIASYFITASVIITPLASFIPALAAAQSTSTPALTNDQKCAELNHTQQGADFLWNPDSQMCEDRNSSAAFPLQAAEERVQATDPKGQGSVTCSGWSFLGSPIICTGRAISAIIGSILITISAKLLEITGLLFNWLVYYTIIGFGDSAKGFLTPEVQKAIGAVWTAFRDISNILIIGMLVFIAISIILGLEKYGQKKLIANVLIVATLINFSLLFTKVIVDVSNFTAFQFYKAAGYSKPPDASAAVSVGSGVTDFASEGIAGQFIRIMGVTSIGDTYTTLREGSDKSNSGWMALMHGIFSATLLFGVAAALLYGSFLIITRAVLIIFLMITSSVAFATYLIPSFAESEYGWNAWWSSLIKSAIFAPLLMMLLWATQYIAVALRPEGGTLGALLQDPQQAGNLSALLGYLLVLGMLFASFKIASAFSAQIGGLNIVNMASKLALGGAGRFAGLAARSTIGKVGASRLSTLQKRMEENPNRAPTTSERWQALAARKMATSSFDALNTKVLGKLGGGLLGKDVGKGGYDATKKRQAEEALKKAEGIGLSGDALKAAQKNSEEVARQSQESSRKNAEETKKAYEEALKNAESHRSGAEDEHRREQAGTREEIANAITGLTKTMEASQQKQAELVEKVGSEVRIAEQRVTNAGTPDAEAAARKHLAEVRGMHQRELDEEKVRIENAKKDIESHQSRLTSLESEAKAAGAAKVEAVKAEAKKGIQETERTIGQLEAQVKAAGEQVKSTVGVEGIAKGFAHRRMSTLYGMLGTPETDPAAKKVKGALAKHHKAESAKSVMDYLKANSHDDHDDHGGGEKKEGGDAHH